MMPFNAATFLLLSSSSSISRSLSLSTGGRTFWPPDLTVGMSSACPSASSLTALCFLEDNWWRWPFGRLWEFLETMEFVAASREVEISLRGSSAPWLSFEDARAGLERSFRGIGIGVLLFLRVTLMARKLEGSCCSSSVALRLRECVETRSGRSGDGVGSFELLFSQPSLIAHHVIGGRGCSLDCSIGLGLFMAHQELLTGCSG